MAKVSAEAIEAAADAIMSTANMNDGEPERFEARLLARVALEAAAPLLAEVWGVSGHRTPPPEGFAWSNAYRSREAGHRDAERASHALGMLGSTVSQRMREVAEARIADPDASWSQIAGKLGLTKDQATGLFRRLMDRLHVAQLRDDGPRA